MKFLLGKLGVQNISDAKEIFLQFFKFGLVGVSNTAVSLAVYYIVLFIDADKYLFGQVLGWIISTGNAFFWSNRYVFKKEEENDASGLMKKILKTYVSYGGSFILCMALLYVQVVLMNISKIVAPVFNLVLTIPLNFLVNKFWTFR